MNFKYWFMTIISVLVTAIIAIAVWHVWSYIPLLGFTILVSVGVLFVVGVAAALVFVMKLFFKADTVEIGQYGVAVRWFNQTTVIAPHAPLAPRAQIADTKVAISVPKVSELLAQNLLGGIDLILGYRENGEVRSGTWADVRTFAVGGKGRSGKSVTMLFYILQALLAGAAVSVCDPHWNKPSGISNVLKPLGRFIRIARTDEEIVALVRDYVGEMERRVNGTSKEGSRPRLLVIDEWTRLVDRRTEEERDVLVNAVCASAEEYAGFEGFAMIAGHEWTAKESGGSKLRRGLHAVMVHRLDADYAKFLLQGVKGKKFAANAPSLKTGQMYLQDSEGDIEHLAIPFGDQADCIRVAEMLSEMNSTPEVAPPAYVYSNSAQIAPPAAASGQLPQHLENLQPKPTGNTWETAQEAIGSTGSTTEILPDDAFKMALRRLGRDLREGRTTRTDVRKQMGITGGRALQELNTALDAIESEEAVSE